MRRSPSSGSRPDCMVWKTGAYGPSCQQRLPDIAKRNDRCHDEKSRISPRRKCGSALYIFVFQAVRHCICFWLFGIVFCGCSALYGHAAAVRHCILRSHGCSALYTRCNRLFGIVCAGPVMVRHCISMSSGASALYAG